MNLSGFSFEILNNRRHNISDLPWKLLFFLLPATSLHEKITEVGTYIKVKWSKEQIGDSDWHPGWYKAEVQSYDIQTDEVSLVYLSEPDCVCLIVFVCVCV